MKKRANHLLLKPVLSIHDCPSPPHHKKACSNRFFTNLHFFLFNSARPPWWWRVLLHQSFPILCVLFMNCSLWWVDARFIQMSNNLIFYFNRFLILKTEIFSSGWGVAHGGVRRFMANPFQMLNDNRIWPSRTLGGGWRRWPPVLIQYNVITIFRFSFNISIQYFIQYIMCNVWTVHL